MKKRTWLVLMVLSITLAGVHSAGATRIIQDFGPGSDAGYTAPPFRAHAAALPGGRPEGPEGFGRRRVPPEAGLLVPGAPKGRKELP